MIKKWLPFLPVIIAAFIVGGLIFSDCGSAKVAYWKGRAEQALARAEETDKKLKEVEDDVEKVQRASNKVIKEKDEEIKTLRAAVAARRVDVERVSEEIIDTPVPPEAEPIVALYKEKVVLLEGSIADLQVALDKAYDIIAQKDAIIAGKDNLITAYLEDKFAQQEAIERLKKRCAVAERAVKRQKLWTYIGKGWTLYHGGKALYGVFKGGK